VSPGWAAVAALALGASAGDAPREWIEPATGHRGVRGEGRACGGARLRALKRRYFSSTSITRMGVSPGLAAWWVTWASR
jgi:hypothetical protein